MKKQQVYEEMEKTIGMVPVFFKTLPEPFLEMEWKLFKDFQLGQTVIPNKYKQLIGIALASSARCQYCTLFHTEAAKLNGATDQEIEEAVHLAKASTGWTTYLNGMQIDYNQFKREVKQITQHLRTQKGFVPTTKAGRDAVVS